MPQFTALHPWGEGGWGWGTVLAGGGGGEGEWERKEGFRENEFTSRGRRESKTPTGSIKRPLYPAVHGLGFRDEGCTRVYYRCCLDMIGRQAGRHKNANAVSGQRRALHWKMNPIFQTHDCGYMYQAMARCTGLTAGVALS